MTGFRGAGALIGALLMLFPGGAAAGLGLARLLAAGSWVAEVVSFFALPVAFAAGLQAWYGLALLGVIPRLVEWARGSGARHRGASRDRQRPLPGSIVFLPLSSGAGMLAGIAAGLVSRTHSFWLVLLVYWLVGTVHGLAAWRLARQGVLIPPESI